MQTTLARVHWWTAAAVSVPGVVVLVALVILVALVVLVALAVLPRAVAAVLAMILTALTC